MSVRLAFLFCLTALAVEAGENDNLVAVIQVFRHGQRTPMSFFANDAYSDPSNWGGLATGQLTNEGKRQHFLLGQFTRRRYADWLPTKYSKNDFFAQTTDVDRTHMSAQSNVHGLYQATKTQVWRKNLDWQPIPIHPADSNIFTAIPPSTCTAYYTERDRLLATDEEFLNLDATYSEVYDYLTKYSGENITSFTDIYQFYDDFKDESDVGFKLPSWASAVYPSPLSELAGHYFESYSHNTKLQRLGNGPIFYKWIQYFEEMAKDPTSNQKFQMYSGHDFNIASSLNTLGAFSPPYPPAFASSFYLELRKNTVGKFFVNALSKNNDQFVKFSINGCALDCPLTEVKAILANILVDADTRDAECLQ